MTDPKPEEINLSGHALASFMRSVLGRDACFRFSARGLSMSPFIRDCYVLTISRSLSGKPMTGDVAAVFDPATGRTLVHRIVARTATGVVIKGDNCRDTDGFFAFSDVIGIVTKAEWNGKRVWFGSGPEKKLIAFLSRTRLLNLFVLPLLRSVKSRM